MANNFFHKAKIWFSRKKEAMESTELSVEVRGRQLENCVATVGTLIFIQLIFLKYDFFKTGSY
jgi:hypothetical protein